MSRTLDRGAATPTRWLAALVTSALVALGAIVGIAVPASAAGPQLTVSQAPRDGGVITVTGTGFTPAYPGVYVGYGPASASGFYSGGSEDPVWVSVGNEVGGDAGSRTAPMNADGSFTVQLTVPAFQEGSGLAVFTSKAHGQGFSDPSQNASAAVTYAPEPEPEPTPEPTEPEPTPEPSEPETPVWEPAIEVYLGDSTTPYAGEPVYDDDVITVTGTGFDPEANIGGRGAPVPNHLPQGTYVVLGSFLPDWEPSTGAGAATRKTVDTRWAMTDASFAAVPDIYKPALTGQRTVLSPEGTFTTTLTAKDFALGLEDGIWGVYTYGAGGVTNASQELSVPINYLGERPTEPETPVWEPAIEVYLADGTTLYAGQALSEGDTLVVKGTGFDPEANVGGAGQPIPADLPQGTFVVFGNFSPVWQPSEGAASAARQSTTASRVWALSEEVLDQVPPAFQPAIRASWADISADGTFTATVTLTTPATLATDGAWGIYTYPGGVGTPANPAQELSVPVTYTTEGTDPETPASPRVTVTPRTLDVGVENVVTVTGTGFTGAGAANGVYVLLGETSLWSGGSALPASGWDALTWVPAALVVDGAFTTTLTIPAGTLDPTKAYQVATSAAHALSATDRSLDTFTTLVVHGTAVETPDLTLEITQDGVNVTSVAQGEAVTIAGGGFQAGETVTAVIESDPVTIGTQLANASGDVVFDWTVPADFEVDTHTVTLTGGASGSIATELTVTAASTEEPAVCDATFAWGIKQSFREYLDRDFVDGTITTSGGVTQRAGNGIFDWSGPVGDLDPAAGTGSVTFPGSVRFYGHHGILDLTFSNVTLRLTSATTGQLLVDYTGYEFIDTTQRGVEISGTGIVLADVELTVDEAGDVVTLAGTATLAETGVVAFGGFYRAGDALDPFALVVPLTADCGETPNPGGPGDGGGTTPTPAPTTPAPAPTTPAPTPTTPAQCVPLPESAFVAGRAGTATLSWGVKESFRSYVTGPIAKGSVAGGTTFSGTPGAITTTNRTGTAAFGGSVTFTGHDGALSLRISNPSVRITSSTSAQLIASVSSKGYNGSADVSGTIVLGNVSLPSPSVSGDTISWRGASVTLTAEGAKAFGGFYSAGDSMDPLTLTVTPAVQGSVDTTGLPTLADGQVYCDDLASTGAGSTDGLGLAAVALLGLGVAVLGIRRRTVNAG